MAKLTSYGGGLYETRQTLVKNFYADTGKFISLDDIFIHGYEKMLKDIILNKFYNMFDVDNIEGLKKDIYLQTGIYMYRIISLLKKMEYLLYIVRMR